MQMLKNLLKRIDCNKWYNYSILNNVPNYPMGVPNFPCPKLPRFTLQQQQQNIRCFHCGKMLYLVWLRSTRKDTVHNQLRSEFRFSSVKIKSTAVFMLQLETAAVA